MIVYDSKMLIGGC